MHRLAIGAAALVLLVSAAIYTSALDHSPPYLMHDELQFSLQARSIAASGRDLSGRLLPIFFTEPEFPAGRDPAIIYYTAGWLRVLPFSQANVKLPTAVLGVINIALAFVAGWLLFESPWGGVTAALLLALTPIHFIRARLVLSPFYAVPFVLGWLIGLTWYVRSGSRRALIGSAACATLSVYTYLACTVMAPVYVLMTLAAAVAREGRRVVLPIIVTVTMLLLPLVIWSLTHPERYGQLIEAYRLYGSGTSSTPVPVLAPGTPTGPRVWLRLVWQFLNPDFLFLSGDSSLINSTRGAGLFPIAFVLLIPLGAWAAIKSRDAMGRVVVIGLLTAPLASVLSGAIEMNRIMFVIPFAALVSAYAVVWLAGRGIRGALAAAGVLSMVVIQFAGFHSQYLTSYPAAAAVWFGGNVRDAVIELDKGTGTAYLTTRTPFANRYWSFYARSDRPMRVVAALPSDAERGSRAACTVDDAACGSAAGWRQVTSVSEPSGKVSFLILEKQ